MVSGLNTDFGNWNLRQMNNPLGWAQAFPEGEIDISKLPPALRQKIEAQRANFGEGDKDKIDTQDEVRKFAELLGQELQNTPGAPPGFDPQLLIDWVLNKQPEQNRPTGGGGQDRGTMSGQNFAQTQPASFSGGSGGGTSGGGGSTGGTSTGGTGGASGTQATSGGPPNTKPSGDVKQWVDQAAEILEREEGIKLTEADKQALYARINQESGGDPHAINDWDSNAAKGTPSKGILQTIDPTFNAYKLAGHDDIWNPVDNIIAAVRYMNDRYGGPQNLPSGGY